MFQGTKITRHIGQVGGLHLHECIAASSSAAGRYADVVKILKIDCPVDLEFFIILALSVSVVLGVKMNLSGIEEIARPFMTLKLLKT